MLLVIEMTCSVTTRLPIVGACFMAVFAAMLLGDMPIYDALRQYTTRQERVGTTE